MENDIDLMRFVVAFLVVLALMFLLAWAVRRAGFIHVMPVRASKRRRLSVSEFLPLDNRRRAVLLRRDDVEHLVILGPDGDCVVEAHIPVSAAVLAAEAAEKKSSENTLSTGTVTP